MGVECQTKISLFDTQTSVSQAYSKAPHVAFNIRVHNVRVLDSKVVLFTIYTTKIDGVVCPPNISETVAGRLMKLAHRQRIASTTIKLNFLLSILSLLVKNNSANRRRPGFG